MTENFRYIGINLSVIIQEVLLNENPFCVSSKRLCLKDNNKTDHWVGQSKLKPLDMEDFL